ncbi:MAG: bifunctional DNA-formamidopyrimidine glycosylase/DNA-(apurinic or apyrimidinic site) lyase [Myxococcota bacterium]|nr:bifunctional DNA-formamidopyrimidine glycosylase/DNA-(apurinic or apyrimidinic site) lyase [Myxococcota bacterium]
MPELPEVETVRRTLAPAVGARITTVWDSAKPLHMQRKPPRAKLRALAGAQILAIRRHGKYLLVDTDRPQSLLVHLGMTGRFCIHGAADVRGTHTHLVLGLADGRELRFTDARRFGQLDVLERAREREHPALAVLGPDALTDGVDPAVLVALARKRKTTLKAFVLDQSVLAGVGNIYASEALWRAKLRPSKRSHRLTVASAKLLADAIHETIANALENGGTTLADFVAADGVKGENADYLWVYDRAGLPCLRCKSMIKRAVHQGRATYYCPTCQTA